MRKPSGLVARCTPATLGLGQHAQTGRVPAITGDVVPARVRGIEAGVDVLGERMRAITDAVAVDTPELVWQGLTVEAVEVLDERVGGETGAQDAGDVLGRPR